MGAGASSSAGEAPLARIQGVVGRAIRLWESTKLLSRKGGSAASQTDERIVPHAFAYHNPE